MAPMLDSSALSLPPASSRTVFLFTLLGWSLTQATPRVESGLCVAPTPVGTPAHPESGDMVAVFTTECSHATP